MIHFGCDYYPEHWPRERWETDVRLMKELGIQVVRMGEFSWHNFEPRPGGYEFDWLDEAIALLADNGISTILGTPTAAPPAWLVRKHPEILPRNLQGQQMGFGGRHHNCQSSTVYRTYVESLVTVMAQHYSSNPNVIGWQIDNELGNSHEDLCTCQSCVSRFHQWLLKKYRTVEALNEEWGTSFWSQQYDSFDQIPAPLPVPTEHNPSLLLDWSRFCSELVIEFQQFQVNILTKYCHGQFITHNFMGFHEKTDYFRLAEALDFVSNDQYPTGYYLRDKQPAYELAATYDFIRSLKKRNFWMMEMQAGPTGGGVIGVTPRPGELRLWASQSVAHGADALIWFRWRTCAFGTEQFWHGILPHSGIPGRRYQELAQTIKELSAVMDQVYGVVQTPPTAILYSYDQCWALKIQPQHPELTYNGQLLSYYRALYNRNVPVDFIRESEDFSEYKVLFAPIQYLMTQELSEKLTGYVKEGGVLVLTMRTGVKNHNNVCDTERELPGELAKAAGIMVRDYDCLQRIEHVPVEFDGRLAGYGTKWCDIIELCGASEVASYAGEYYSGSPAATCNFYGRGKVYYVATDPDAELMETLVSEILSGTEVEGLGKTPEGVELALRPGKKGDVLFALNHTGEEKEIDVSLPWHSIQKGPLQAYGVRIYTREALL